MTNPTARPSDPDQSVTYDIRLQGHLDARWMDRLGVRQLTHESDGTTLLSLVAADQSALHGLLLRIRDLGVPLISVVRIDPGI